MKSSLPDRNSPIRNAQSTIIRVVLADDHAMMRDGLRMLLNAQPDITVIGGAADGREAVCLTRQTHPDVVVMDIAMPNLNGIEATRQIREICPSTQVVVLSMYGTLDYVRQAWRAGARGYLLKESAGKELVDAIRAAYAGQRYVSQKIGDVVIEAYMQPPKPSPEEDPLECLSPREREVLQLVVEGKSSARIAESLHLSPKTVDTYRSRLMHKLGIKDVPSLVKFAIEHRLPAAATNTRELGSNI